METIRVVQWGLGAMGSGIARLVLDKPGLSLVAAIDHRPDLAGRDLGDVLGTGERLGIAVMGAPSDLGALQADLVIMATTSWLASQAPDLRAVMQAGMNCISIAEEMADPYAQHPELAGDLDRLAKQQGVTLLGAGVNPGFVMDLLVITLTGACHAVTHIEVVRRNDLSPYGPTVMHSQGVGLWPAEFHQALQEGAITGHVGFPESIHLISSALGLGVDRVEQVREPIVSQVRRETPYVRVEPGMVAGCAHTAVGYRDGQEVIRLSHPQQVHPGLEGQETGDYIHITGVPEIHAAIQPEIAGGTATTALAVNMIPLVVTATPGLKRMIDLPVPAALLGESAYRRGS